MLENTLLGNALFTTGILVLLLLFAWLYFMQQLKRREDERKKQELLDNTDELTQISNRKYIDYMLEKEVDRARRHERGLSFVIIEIDEFEKIRQNFGQQFSKRVLKDTAENLQERIRAYDVIARDKHRFLCLFPETDMEAALLLSKRARAVVAAETYYFRVDGDPIHVTASIGVTTCKPHADSNIDINAIKNAANHALETAKRKGTNTVEFIQLENGA